MNRRQEAAEAEGRSATSGSEGISAFIARVLAQLSLSAWLPAAFFTVAITVLTQFRRQKSMDVSNAVRALTSDPLTLLVLAVPVLVCATLVTQAFSFEAIRTLEGYWRRRGPASALRSLLIRWQLRRKRRLQSQRVKASHKAFLQARAKWLKSQPAAIVDALERDALGEKRPTLSAEEDQTLARLNWWALSDPWLVAKVEHLATSASEYPRDSRILPTRLGNLIRATEDRLQHAGQDLEGFALRRRHFVSQRVREQHDQFRTRLDMYSILTMVAALLATLTPCLLLGSVDSDWRAWVAVITAGFAATSWASYQAGIASARGYLAALRQMDRRVEQDDT